MNNLKQIELSNKRKNIVQKFEDIATDNLRNAIDLFSNLEYNGKVSVVDSLLSSFLDNYIPLAKGNSNLRISGLSEKNDSNVLLFQYYFEKDTLNSYRRLLDALALYSNENFKDYKSLVPIIIFDMIPNKRVDMWETLADIKKILGINFKIMTVYGLWMVKNIKVDFDEFLQLSDFDKIRNGEMEHKIQDKYVGIKEYGDLLGVKAIMKPIK